jgi:MOSC domain-containing protein YiiM
MFGVPPGPVYEPAETTEEILDGFVIAPLDLALWPAPEQGNPGVGLIEAIVIAPEATASVHVVASAEAIPGKGLTGDRYQLGAGTFGSGRPGSALTLVEAEVLEGLAATRGAPIDHRRNLVVRGMKLNSLVGRRFRVGEDVVCEGRRLCEPCAHLDRLNSGDVLKPLIHRGGLRADIVVGGVVRVGDRVTTASDGA